MTREEIEELKGLAASMGFYDDKNPCKRAVILGNAIQELEQESSYNSVNSLVESKLKNPKAKTFDILHFIADNAGLSTFEAIEKAYIMGVSEQEAVLDKIRGYINHIRNTGLGKNKSLEFIEKYIDGLKAESEDNE